MARWRKTSIVHQSQVWRQFWQKRFTLSFSIAIFWYFCQLVFVSFRGNDKKRNRWREKLEKFILASLNKTGAKKVATSGFGLFDSLKLSRGWRESASLPAHIGYHFFWVVLLSVKSMNRKTRNNRDCCIQTLLLASLSVTSGKFVLWALGQHLHGRGEAATKMENWFTNLFVIGNINLVTDLILQNHVAAAAAAAATHVCFACVSQVRNARRCASQSL